MNNQEIVRANEFDEVVGKLQTLKSIELGTGNMLLDIGCGIGQFTPMFLKKFKFVTGLDPNKKFIDEANRKDDGVNYVCGYGETFKPALRYDTINMTNLLEHVDDPVALLKNCKKMLKPKGRIIAQVPNANSVTRRIGVLMGLIPSLDYISDIERDKYGHKRSYFLYQLIDDFVKAGLKIKKMGGVFYKPLPNRQLGEIYFGKVKEWQDKFLKAMVEFGEDREEECAQIYICAE